MKEWVFTSNWKFFDFNEESKIKINRLMLNILNEIPPDNKILKEELKSIMDSFSYKAPENTYEIVSDLYAFLRKRIATIKNPPAWVDNIYTLWIEEHDNYKVEFI